MTSAPGASNGRRPRPGLRRLVVAVAGSLLKLCGRLRVASNVPRETLGGERPVVVPLRRRADLLYAFEATIGAAGRRDVALDTGSNLLLLRGETADALRFDRDATCRIYLQGSDASAWRFVRRGRVPSLRLHGDGAAAEFRDVEAVSPETWAFSDLAGGTLFAHGLLTLDLPGERLMFERGELPPPDGATIFACSDVKGVLAAEVSVSGESFFATIDTGFVGGLAAPRALAARLPKRLRAEPIVFETAHGPRISAVGVLEATLAWGAFRLTDVPLVVQEGAPLLGLAVLRRFVITFDHRNRRLRLATPPAPAAS